MPVLPDDGSSRVSPGSRAAVFLGLLHHRQGDAVLHRPAGVLALELDQDADVGVGAERADVDQRGVADQVEDARDRAMRSRVATPSAGDLSRRPLRAGSTP